ncbi:MAG: NTP transferase domain-containing protein [Spirosomataceae bacterium]
MQKRPVSSLSENKLLIDTYETGPLGGVLTAFEYDEHTAWLVVACDMPFVNTATFDFLIHHRSPEHIATAFKNPLTQLPEPLLSIWEPTSYYFLKEAYQNGQRSPLKILHNTDSHLIDCPDEHWLWNANTVEEFTQMANILAQCK